MLGKEGSHCFLYFNGACPAVTADAHYQASGAIYHGGSRWHLGFFVQYPVGDDDCSPAIRFSKALDIGKNVYVSWQRLVPSPPVSLARVLKNAHGFAVNQTGRDRGRVMAVLQFPAELLSQQVNRNGGAHLRSGGDHRLSPQQMCHFIGQFIASPVSGQ